MKLHKQIEAMSEIDGWEPVPEGHFHPDNPHGQKPPNYPNDLRAVAQVAKKVSAMGFRMGCNSGRDGTWECVVTKRTEGDLTIPVEGDHYGCGDELSEAMTEAILRATGKWTP